jgi:putative transposase
MLRYVEANGLRAGLVERAEAWRWCSAAAGAWRDRLLSPWPIERPANWAELVNAAQPTDEVKAVRHSVKRNYPFGSLDWATSTAAVLGITLRPSGRPRKPIT